MRQNQFVDIKNETPRQRSDRIKRNRQIRKQRLYGISYFIEQTCPTEPVKEEKGYMQKLKNRQAAQKSREQKKMYVTQLEEEIKDLKQKLSNLRHCENCKKQLQISHSEVQNTYEETNSRGEISMEDELESSFIRVSSTDENSSIGIYLFVFMIILGVFCIGSRMDTTDGFTPMRRDLTQMFKAEEGKIGDITSPVEYETNQKSTYSTTDYIKSNPKNQEKRLLSMDQVKSPSLISDEKYFEKIITSFENYKIDEYDDKNLRSKVGLIDANKSLMFCSRPKIYRSSSNDEGILTAFIDIFVKGAEIISIFPQTGQDPLNSGNFQLDGLYKITASVEQIAQIGNPNLIY